MCLKANWLVLAGDKRLMRPEVIFGTLTSRVVTNYMNFNQQGPPMHARIISLLAGKDCQMLTMILHNSL